MKKILLSVSIIAAVAAVVFGITTAFFSDTETSTGNTFTAGELDLKFQVEGVPGQWTDVNGAPLFDGLTFPMNDLKPGDKGEKTVRLWVDDNASCGKFSVNVTEDLDNTCTEPEIGDEPNCATSPTGVEAGSGELNDAVNFAIWADTNCNNVYDPGETPLTQGTITSDKDYSIGELPIGVANAQCYGIAYCFGAWNPLDGTCDGFLVDNTSQSDSFKADLIIEALQKRNQTFSGETTPGICPPVGDWPIES